MLLVDSQVFPNKDFSDNSSKFTLLNFVLAENLEFAACYQNSLTQSLFP